MLQIVGRRLVWVPQRPPDDVTRVEGHDDQAGNEAREKDLDDRNLGRHRIDHHGDRGWDEDPERAGPGQRAEAHFLIVAPALQLGQRDLGDGGAGCGRGTRDRSEDAAAEHVHMHQTARQPADPRRETAKHLFGKFGPEQDLAHPDEEGQGGQRPGIGAAPRRGGEDLAGRHLSSQQQGNPAARHQRHRDPDAPAQQQREHAEQQEAHLEQVHGQTPLSAARSMISSAVFGGSRM